MSWIRDIVIVVVRSANETYSRHVLRERNVLFGVRVGRFVRGANNDDHRDFAKAVLWSM